MSHPVKPTDLPNELIAKIDIAVKKHIIDIMEDLGISLEKYASADAIPNDINFAEDLGLSSLEMVEFVMNLNIDGVDVDVDLDKVREAKTLQEFLVLVYDAYPR